MNPISNDSHEVVAPTNCLIFIAIEQALREMVIQNIDGSPSLSIEVIRRAGIEVSTSITLAKGGR